MGAMDRVMIVDEIEGGVPCGPGFILIPSSAHRLSARLNLGFHPGGASTSFAFKFACLLLVLVCAGGVSGFPISCSRIVGPNVSVSWTGENEWMSARVTATLIRSY